MNRHRFTDTMRRYPRKEDSTGTAYHSSNRVCLETPRSGAISTYIDAIQANNKAEHVSLLLCRKQAEVVLNLKCSHMYVNAHGGK
jgi:hypothetical protein